MKRAFSDGWQRRLADRWRPAQADIVIDWNARADAIAADKR